MSILPILGATLSLCFCFACNKVLRAHNKRAYAKRHTTQYPKRRLLGGETVLNTSGTLERTAMVNPLERFRLARKERLPTQVLYLPLRHGYLFTRPPCPFLTHNNLPPWLVHHVQTNTGRANNRTTRKTTVLTQTLANTTSTPASASTSANTKTNYSITYLLQAVSFFDRCSNFVNAGHGNKLRQFEGRFLDTALALKVLALLTPVAWNRHGVAVRLSKDETKHRYTHQYTTREHRGILESATLAKRV